MGVEHAWFSCMGEALVQTLQELLGRMIFTPPRHRSWLLVYNVLAAEMCVGMDTDKIVFATWAQVKSVPYYKEKMGLLIFQALFKKYPDTKELFGLPIDLATDAESLKASVHFRMHAEYFVLMLDKALAMVESKSMQVLSVPL